MKAILIIDIPEEFNDEELSARYDVFYYPDGHLPQKQKDLAFAQISFFAEKYIRVVNQLTEKEYKNIIKEIVNDTCKDNKHRS